MPDGLATSGLCTMIGTSSTAKPFHRAPRKTTTAQPATAAYRCLVLPIFCISAFGPLGQLLVVPSGLRGNVGARCIGERHRAGSLTATQRQRELRAQRDRLEREAPPRALHQRTGARGIREPDQEHCTSGVEVGVAVEQ